MKKHCIALSVLAASIAGTTMAAEGPVPRGVPELDHVFVIIMENHGYSQIINNPNAPYINQFANSANLAKNYFAVAHPSLTNYLEIVGGSNFGVHTDNYPDWHNFTCASNLSTGTVATDNPPSPLICPIDGHGTDAETPAIDFVNEASGPPGTINIDGITSIPAASGTLGKTIGDQLAAAGGTWKSYQEGLPAGDPDKVNYSDGFFSNLTDFATLTPSQSPPLTSAGIVALYAAKHNPFVYFRSVQEGTDSRNSLKNVVSFDGPHGLFSDLADGHVPSLSFIAPNQCNDQHGRGNAGPFCAFDPSDDGTQAGLNPALIKRGDIEVKNLVDAIKASRAWKGERRSAIVVVWDENDYSTAPNTNQVVAIVDTNYGVHGVQSTKRYTHFSLLKTIEGALRLPCLNHACDEDVTVMADLFGGDRDGGDRD